jgi:hypothetical protein
MTFYLGLEDLQGPFDDYRQLTKLVVLKQKS